jgi:hypothetical protein
VRHYPSLPLEALPSGAPCVSMTNQNPAAWQRGNPAAGLGLQLAVGMAVFVGGGFWLDQKRGGGVLFTLLGAGLGLFYCGYEIWKLARTLNGKGERQKEKLGDVRQP